MKSTFLFLAILICNISLSAADSSASLDVKFICNEVAYFIAPTQQNFAVGDDVYVKVDFNDKRFVRLVKLYIGHQLIRLDNAAPFEWGVPNGSNDTQLRNMPAGNYSLTAEVVYSCGNKRHFKKTIKVGSSPIVFAQLNPVYSLVWLKNIHKSQPNSKISEFKRGSRTYYKIEPCHTKSGYISWYDPQGRLSGKYRTTSSNQGQFRYARLVKTWIDPCK